MLLKVYVSLLNAFEQDMVTDVTIQRAINTTKQGKALVFLKKKVFIFLTADAPISRQMTYSFKLSNISRMRTIQVHQGVTKRCRLSWLTNGALVYAPKCRGG
jgi:hypothetical protein